MHWSQVEHRIRAQIVPGITRVPTCDGVKRRAITSNTVDKIGMSTGARTRQTKAITYEMLKHAYQVLQTRGRFDSSDFRSRFGSEYQAAPCRYSMTGGVLVEIGVATVVPNDGNDECYYRRIDVAAAYRGVAADGAERAERPGR